MRDNQCRKGHVARTNKGTIFVRNEQKALEAYQLFGTKVKIEIFPNLEAKR